VERETDLSPTYILPLPKGGGGLRRRRENIRALPKWLAIIV